MTARPGFILRPEPGLQRTLAAARELGLEAHGAPLFAIAPLAWEAPDPSAYDGLLLGSANALRHGGDGLESLRSLPVHAVGDITAALAREAGFRVASVGEGGLDAVVSALDGARLSLLRLAGRDRVALSPPAGIAVEDQVVYEARALPLDPQLAGRMESGGVVLLHSAAAARHFASECDRLALDRGRLSLAVIGPRVAAAAGEGWLDIRTARRPRDAALLELALAMCQTDASNKP